ncbi:MAG: 16S rRNA (cytosine(1402)-N(4))-methyltransferase RsmH [Rickettsiales bacterium]|jgi:16S rRNA (cytosine1402-N4)-methyltransferase|nr:16S rRNA (cytosine(1402)-N(4))-methyltransferase RsmH [Rickettsiales bacterium]
MHISVLLKEVLEYLSPQQGETIIDGTFGAGGYSRAILEAGANVIAFDRDPSVTLIAAKLTEEYPSRFTFHNDKFSNIAKIITEPADGLVLDLGVSSMQLDEAERGFSFRADAPLLMEMGGNDRSAADILNMAKEAELSQILKDYGEVRGARAIARKIVAARPLQTTFDLAALVPKQELAKVFQAVRIAVNDELTELRKALEGAAGILKPGGRMVVVSFHSLEDRMVKDFLRPRATTTNRYAPPAPVQAINLFQVLTKNAIIPTAEETRRNPRASSARLRAGVRI